MREWSFLTNHARVLLFIAAQPDARLRDFAAELDVTERTAFGIVADLTTAGYVVKPLLPPQTKTASEALAVSAPGVWM